MDRGPAPARFPVQPPRSRSPSTNKDRLRPRPGPEAGQPQGTMWTRFLPEACGTAMPPECKMMLEMEAPTPPLASGCAASSERQAPGTRQLSAGLPRSLESREDDWGERLLWLLRVRTLGTPSSPFVSPCTGAPVACTGASHVTGAVTKAGRESVVQSVLPHIAQATQFSVQPSSYVFCLDLSGSMGHFSAWSPGNCSRVSLALSYLAAYIQRALAPHDWFTVLGFAADCRTMLGWRQRGAGFDMGAFMEECRKAAKHIRRSGTHLFTAFAEACRLLRERVGSVEAAVEAAAAAAAGQQEASWTQPGVPAAGGSPPRLVVVHSPPAPPMLGIPVPAGAAGWVRVEDPAPHGAPAQARPASAPPPTNAVMLLTDGEACDPSAFSQAQQAMCAPGFDFKALLMKIDTGSPIAWLHAPQLSALARFLDGSPIPYVSYTELQLPFNLDLARRSSRSAMDNMSHAFNSFSQTPSALSMHSAPEGLGQGSA